MPILLFLFLTIIACAPLNPTFTPLEKTGEVVGRTILCPLTLCFSEVGFYQNYQAEQKREAYEQWRASLSPEEQDREDRRQAEAARSLAIGLAGIPKGTRPSGMMVYRHQAAPVFCSTNLVGSSAYTTCP